MTAYANHGTIGKTVHTAITPLDYYVVSAIDAIVIPNPRGKTVSTMVFYFLFSGTGTLNIKGVIMGNPRNPTDVPGTAGTPLLATSDFVSLPYQLWTDMPGTFTASTITITTSSGIEVFCEGKDVVVDVTAIQAANTIKIFVWGGPG